MPRDRSPSSEERNERRTSGKRPRDDDEKRRHQRDGRRDNSAERPVKRRRSSSAEDEPRHRERSRRDHHHSSRRRSRSPRRRSARSPSRSRSPPRRSRKALPSQDVSYRGENGADMSTDALEKSVEKQKPNYKPTGLLAAESNKITVSGGKGKDPTHIVLKYHEPSEARKPPTSQPWICYIFKGDAKEPLDTIKLHERSCWLLGRETQVADIETAHPSCSKQHAVFQFRYVTKKDEWGEKKSKVGLYVIDLESANGTFLNGERVEGARYVECLTGDVVRFGESEREYVVLLPPKEKT